MMRVMVVEDEEMIRKGIVMAVDWAALDCIVVGEAANGEQALAVAEDCQPTLIITDLKMPKMDGLEMVRRLREAGSRAYVIILTAYDSFAYAQTAIRLGAVDFLLKPFHDGDLEGAVLELLDLRAVVAHVTELAAEIGDVLLVFELDLVDGAAGEVDAEVQPLHEEGNDAGDDEDDGERVSEFSLTYEIKVHCWPSFRLMP